MDRNEDYTRPVIMDRPNYKLYCMYRGPGPAYQLKKLIGTGDHCVTKSQAPAYSMGSPYKWKMSENPGPSYNYDASLTNQGIHRPPRFSFSGRPRVKGPEILPGPGAYDAHTVKDPLPRMTMGQRTRIPVSHVPSPNAYNVRTGIGSGSATEKRVPSCTIQGRPALGSAYYSTFKAANPGPSAYGPPPAEATRSVRSCTMKSRCHVKDYNTAKDNPGPGAYDVKGSTGTSGDSRRRRGFSMGIRHSEYLMPLITCHDTVTY